LVVTPSQSLASATLRGDPGDPVNAAWANALTVVRTGCVIVDIDGTLADNSHRQHHLNHGDYDCVKNDWAAFFAGIPDDKPITPVVEVVDALRLAGWPIVLATGRSETNRAATQAWLEKHGIVYDELYMRAADCYRQDAIVKSEMLDRILADGWDPLLVIDDRQSVVDMWRSRGLVCLQAAKGDF
jgi:hypothetical protein